MTASQSIARLRQQSRRCELSRASRCHCRCGGQYHGAPHPPSWFAEVVQAIRLDAATRADEFQLTFPGFAP